MRVIGSTRGIATFLIVSFSLLVSVCVLFVVREPGYRLYFLHPLVYAVSYACVLGPAVRRSSARAFVSVFALIAGIRFVVLPLLVVVSGHFYGRSRVDPLPDSFMHAISLMILELVLCTLLIAFMERKKSAPISRAGSGPELRKKANVGYWGFGVVVVAMAVLFPQGLLNLSFVVPSALSRDMQDMSVGVNFTAYTILVLKNLAFAVFAANMARRFRSGGSKLWILLAVFGALVNVSIYWGSSRSDIIITGVASAILLNWLFGPVVRRYFVLGAALVVVAVALVSVERETITYTRGGDAVTDIADTFQVYTGGVYNVAIAIETVDYFPEARGAGVLMMDLFRPMLGPNILLKDSPYLYSNVYFNQRMWTHVDRRSQIVPMVGQGYIHFGSLLSPLLTLIFVGLAYFISHIMSSTRSPEIYYFCGLVVVRMGFMMGQNTMNMINDLSMNLFLFFGVYLINRVLSRRGA